MISPAYIYKAEVISVHDGDTLVADIDCGFNIWMRSQSIRLIGINAPELKDKNVVSAPVEGRDMIVLAADGLASRDALVNLLTHYVTSTRVTFGLPTIIFSRPTPVVIETAQDKAEKYGRWLGRIWLNTEASKQVDVNQWMVDNGHAVPYMVG